jgi:hypothetical protein
MTSAIWFRRCCRDITVRDCLLTDLGAGGVKIAETKTAAKCWIDELEIESRP